MGLAIAVVGKWLHSPDTPQVVGEHLPPLLSAAIAALKDDSWAVREAACLAWGDRDSLRVPLSEGPISVAFLPAAVGGRKGGRNMLHQKSTATGYDPSDGFILKEAERKERFICNSFKPKKYQRR